MSPNNYMYNSTSENSDSNTEQLSPPQSNPRPTTTTPSTQPPHQHPQLSNPPPYQSTPQTSQPIQQGKSGRAGIIGATTGGLTAHLLGGGILSTIGGAMAGAAGAKKISEGKRDKKKHESET